MGSDLIETGRGCGEIFVSEAETTGLAILTTPAVEPGSRLERNEKQ